VHETHTAEENGRDRWDRVRLGPVQNVEIDEVEDALAVGGPVSDGGTYCGGNTAWRLGFPTRTQSQGTSLMYSHTGVELFSDNGSKVVARL
jgi:hypothetical protein